mmetsp:Transcript_26209/g.73282  ORF Transcript_26209/g.73282 Transcript_26209/m.73282 type:complete len:223 (-) Transcript_26209:914-1582(-)
MLLAVIFKACWRMSSCCFTVGFFSPFRISLTWRRFCTRLRTTVGSTAMSSAEGGRGGSEPSSGRSTVVKQMLYSWMMEGYSELKSSSRMKSSYSPFFGSSTRPPAYDGPFFFPPLPWSLLFRALSGMMNLRLWNSCSSRYSIRWARPPRSTRLQRNPERFAICRDRGIVFRWKSSPKDSHASRSAVPTRPMRAAVLWKHALTSGTRPSVRSPSCDSAREGRE